jgi:murein L,D-transpeptidase YcbB/YkuD
MAIFMHDTPKEHLFDKQNRTFSSGCIRLGQPFEMAYFLLKDQGISRSELQDMYYIDDGVHPDTEFIDLEEDVPVHMIYATAWTDRSGYLHFAEDVYDRDNKLETALNL